MFGENAVRRNAAPISSAMEWKACLKIPNSMGSMLFMRAPRPKGRNLAQRRKGAKTVRTRNLRNLRNLRIASGSSYSSLRNTNYHVAVSIDLRLALWRDHRSSTVFHQHRGTRESVTRRQQIALIDWRLIWAPAEYNPHASNNRGACLSPFELLFRQL